MLSLELAPNIIPNLNVIASLKPADKLNTSDIAQSVGETTIRESLIREYPLFYIDTATYYQCLVRYYYGANRSTTLCHLTAMSLAISTFITTLGIQNARLLLYPPDGTSNAKRIRRRRHKYRALRKRISKSAQNSLYELHRALRAGAAGLITLANTYSTDTVIYNGIRAIASELEHWHTVLL